MKMTRILWIMIALSLLFGCSINKLAVNKMAEMLSSEESSVFTGDDDPELIRDALPFGLKLYETLSEQVPENSGLLLSTGRVFAMYAFAFIQDPAERLPESEIDKQIRMKQRAKKLYLRARRYVLRGLENNHPGFTNLILRGDADKALLPCKKEDVPYLYWAGLSWMGAFTADTFDMSLAVQTSRPVKMLQKALDLLPDYDNGAIHEFFISYYGSLPVIMGGSEEKARRHFQEAIRLSRGKKAGPYIALATSVAVAKQDAAEFRSLLDAALTADVNADSQNRLVNIIYREKAQWLLEHMDNYFLLEK